MSNEEKLKLEKKVKELNVMIKKGYELGYWKKVNPNKKGMKS